MKEQVKEQVNCIKSKLRSELSNIKSKIRLLCRKSIFINKLRDLNVSAAADRIWQNRKSICTDTFKNLVMGGYVFAPYTAGKVAIIENLSGDAPEEITYYRFGGVMQFADYLAHAPQERKDKFYSFEDHPEYVYEGFIDDCDFEEGHCYLFYAVNDDGDDRYFLPYVKYGTRELYGYDPFEENTTDAYMIDPDTKEEISLADYIEKYF